ncbi:DUF5694 domain-containing protein [Hyphomonas sp.]|uniref:DUF5694 domain-containing protein n=1 Tax=Hyphomonas sp. TaxID=87 RepID=UPI00391CC004
MKSKLAALALLALPIACTTLPEPADNSEASARTTEVMVLGTYHMDNPGADLVNMDADDVLAPARQAELEALVRRLAAFQPTAIMVEAESKRPDLIDTGYLNFTPDQLGSDRNEITQIAYRLAHELRIERVYGVDTREGEIDFFPFEKVQSFEAAKGIDVTGPMIAQVQAEAAEFSEAQKTETISHLLARQNDPAHIKAMHGAFYYGLLELADATSQPGAQLNYGWYARNALTFSKIAATTEPGDRVIVLYGSGHAYWLRHFTENTPGFSLVEPADYLED